MNKIKVLLSDDQRQQVMDVAKAVYKGYQKMYQPIYDEVTGKLEKQGIPDDVWPIPDLNKLSEAASARAGILNDTGGAPAGGDTSPVQGARKAPDGKWYVPNPAGGYFQVEP